MAETKYVELDHVLELLKLIRLRDSYMDWTKQYETCNEEVKEKIEYLLNNAKTFE